MNSIRKITLFAFFHALFGEKIRVLITDVNNIFSVNIIDVFCIY
jgi:hypothetical protein